MLVIPLENDHLAVWKSTRNDCDAPVAEFFQIQIADFDIGLVAAAVPWQSGSSPAI